ncbi:MAG: phosphonoacetaldehyde hydrolase [Pseudomonadota bacterium]
MENIKAVVFDWAGTMVDFGSFAPMNAFVEVFAEFGMAISIEQARAPMGMAKWDHIKTILDMPGVANDFKATYGHAPSSEDVDRIFKVFVPMNEKVAARHSDLVPGAAAVIKWLSERDIKIGSTTGYTRSIMEHVIPVAAKQGYSPEIVVCSDEVPNGRPAPDAMEKCFEVLGIDDPSKVIKVDDTEPGIGEGKQAGCLTVGLTLSGNYAGKTPDELSEMDEKAINELREHAAEKLFGAGADHVIDSVADLPELISSLAD